MSQPCGFPGESLAVFSSPLNQLWHVGDSFDTRDYFYLFESLLLCSEQDFLIWCDVCYKQYGTRWKHEEVISFHFFKCHSEQCPTVTIISKRTPDSSFFKHFMILRPKKYNMESLPTLGKKKKRTVWQNNLFPLKLGLKIRHCIFLCL